MISALRSVVFLLTGYALLSLGTGLISILLPVRMGIEGVSSQTAGLAAAYYGGFVVGCSAVRGSSAGSAIFAPSPRWPRC
jgi:hypothetical protein